MKVLVIGSGGREHAIAWKLARSPKVQQVFVAPGNGGTHHDAELKNIAVTDKVELRQWAQQEGIDLTVDDFDCFVVLGLSHRQKKFIICGRVKLYCVEHFITTHLGFQSSWQSRVIRIATRSNSYVAEFAAVTGRTSELMSIDNHTTTDAAG